jgi:hypothetical protein
MYGHDSIIAFVTPLYFPPYNACMVQKSTCSAAGASWSELICIPLLLVSLAHLKLSFFYMGGRKGSE